VDRPFWPTPAVPSLWTTPCSCAALQALEFGRCSQKLLESLVVLRLNLLIFRDIFPIYYILVYCDTLRWKRIFKMQRERWPVNFVTPDQLQAHRSRQQSQMDFWDHYRRGQPWSQHQREPIYRHFQVPKTIPPWLGPRQLFVPNPGHPGAPRPVGSRFTQQIPQPFWVMDPRGVEARKNVRALTREFYPDRFFFVKTLSWGGFGVASLFEVGNSQNPATRRVFVVKTNLIGEDVAASQRDAARRRATSMMKREKHFQQKFLRAKHIVQIMQPKKTRTSARVAAAQPPAGGFPYAPMASEDPPTAAFARENTMILEYLVRGDLRKNLGAIAHDPNAVVPNRVLWSIFRCRERKFRISPPAIYWFIHA